MADYGHDETDKLLAELEKRISSVYGKAAKEMQDTIEEYFKLFEKRDAEMLKLLEAGEISSEHYKQWRLAQIGRGRRFEALRDKLAERMTNANETAVAYVNDSTPGIYSLNRNYAAYTIEQYLDDVDFTLWDEQTVKRLIVEQSDLMPNYPAERAVKRGIDLAYGKKQITAQMTTGILMGESLKKLADRLQTNIPDMNRKSAIRAARTATTGAENAGRLDTFIAAKEMGIPLKKQWLATLDLRTRHSHQQLDLKIVEVEDKFPNGLMYPGDTSGRPEEVYNCRCTMLSEADGDIIGNIKRRARNPLTGRNEVIDSIPYPEWFEKKRSEDPQAFDIAVKKTHNLSNDKTQWKEYKSIAGNSAGKTFSDFQALKYERSDEWNYTKRLMGYLRKYSISDKRFFDVQEQLKAAGINMGVLLPPIQKKAYILPEGKRDPYHIMHRMMERSITDDELRGYMTDAKCMFVQWGGKRRLFVGYDGACVITDTGEDWIFKTAWKKVDYDEDTERIVEVLKDAGL